MMIDNLSSVPFWIPLGIALLSLTGVALLNRRPRKTHPSQGRGITIIIIEDRG